MLAAAYSSSSARRATLRPSLRLSAMLRRRAPLAPSRVQPRRPRPARMLRPSLPTVVASSGSRAARRSRPKSERSRGLRLEPSKVGHDLVGTDHSAALFAAPALLFPPRRLCKGIRRPLDLFLLPIPKHIFLLIASSSPDRAADFRSRAGQTASSPRAQASNRMWQQREKGAESVCTHASV